MRRSISCMCAGLLISAPVWLFIHAAENQWYARHWAVPTAAITICIAGIVWLYDELIA